MDVRQMLANRGTVGRFRKNGPENQAKGPSILACQSQIGDSRKPREP